MSFGPSDPRHPNDTYADAPARIIAQAIDNFNVTYMTGLALQLYLSPHANGNMEDCLKMIADNRELMRRRINSHTPTRP